ncbi:hypothetical protein GQX74_014971 [Glossina fuscipes]|nr:hypothetical protein GQX74_014971 [Glossina fuscipes]
MNTLLNMMLNENRVKVKEIVEANNTSVQIELMSAIAKGIFDVCNVKLFMDILSIDNRQTNCQITVIRMSSHGWKIKTTSNCERQDYCVIYNMTAVINEYSAPV